MARRIGFPRRIRPLRRLPALSLFPGQIPVQAAQCLADAKTDMSGPSSTRIAMAESRLTPGRVSRSRTWASQGARAASIRRLAASIRAVSLSNRSRRSPRIHRACMSSSKLRASPRRAELLADMPAQPAQGVRARLTGDDALEDAATVDPVGDPAENAADAHPAPVQDLLDAQLRARPLFDQRAAVAAQPPQVAEALRQHQARAPEAELADARQPDAVRDIGLAPLDLLDVLGVDHHDIETGVGQNVVDLLPVDARRVFRMSAK